MVPTPATFYDCLALMLVLAWAMLQAGGRRVPDANTLNVRRCAFGAAGIAIFSFVMVSAAHDLRGGFAALAQYFIQLRSAPPSWPLGLTLSVLGLVFVASLWRLLAGWRGPFPPRRSMLGGGDFLWLAGGAVVWLWGGLFVDPASWLGRYGRIWNFGLEGFLLYGIVESAVSVLVMLRNPGAARPLVEGDIAAGTFEWDERPRRRWWQRKK
jgi:hypothetical protein